MKRLRGVSLIELAIVVAVLGIIAIIVLPNLAATNEKQLELATGRVAEALRFARSEAMRTESVIGVLVDTNDQTGTAKDIAVFTPDWVANPFGLAAFLRHPLSKQPYDLWLNGSSGGSHVSFSPTTAPFLFDGLSGARKYIFFDASGAPVSLENGVLHRFTGGSVTLARGNLSATVVVEPVSGLVSVQ